MASSSNAPLSASAQIQDLEYLYASNTNVSNFVSVKLSGNRNYPLWKAQMLCLMVSHNMRGIVEDTFRGPRDSGSEILMQYDSLLKGWIFGSVSEDVLVPVYNLGSAKDVWEKLKSIYDPTMSFQQDSALMNPEVKTKTKDIDDVSADTNTNGKDTISIEIIGKDIVSTETEIKGDDAETETNGEKTIEQKKKLREATIKGNWSQAESILKENKDLATAEISGDHSMVLHIAVELGHNDFMRNLFSYINDEEVLIKRKSDGSTALHIAAFVGNRYAVDLLVKKNKKLLSIKDHKGAEPWYKACEYMHLDILEYLLKYVNDDVEIGGDLLVNFISAKQYNLALYLIKNFPKSASKNDHVIMALAKNFPSGLDFGERAIYPSFDGTRKIIYSVADFILESLLSFPVIIINYISSEKTDDLWFKVLMGIFGPGLGFIYFLIFIVWYLFLIIYFLFWKGARILGAPITDIEKKKKEWNEGIKILKLVCDEIDKLEFSGTPHPYYTRPIVEAASKNAYNVVEEILKRSPEAIQSKDKRGYDIIQLAVIHRSEKIYNLIYDLGERKNLYKKIEDSSKNNILHLAGKLAPSNELDQRAGAALQLQRELQWREEVKKFVFPTYLTRENIFKETPDMLFTREHENMVREGEKWMKTTAESCSITAALIITIVFAAAITVPGGSYKEKGIPMFKKETAFTFFAVSDAISLFASSTSLLVFLSILTARFAENDFLESLPRRLFIGLFFLLLSTAAMVVAFSATLFIVFLDQKPWMLFPICGLSFIPHAFFVALQYSLMADLFRSTYLPIFGKERKRVLRSNLDVIRLFFVK